MTPVVPEAEVVAFLAALLQREGAAAEVLDARRLEAVMEPDLAVALDLPEAATLAVFGAGGPEDVAFPLEGLGVQWAVDQARERGRWAGARLPRAPRVTTGLVQEAKRLARPLNAQLEHVEVLPGLVTVALLEYAYEARSEERADGVVFVAVPDGVGTPSLSLASGLLEWIEGGVPERPVLAPRRIEALAASAMAVARTDVGARLGTYLESREERLRIEQARLTAYFDNLAREASRNRRRPRGGGPGLADKRAAIVRQREERLAELASRHAVEVEVRLASALVLRYEAVVCRFHLRRRRTSLQFDALCDAVGGEVLGPACEGCGTGTVAFHACDGAGHLTCARCAARCPSCRRTTCRACTPGGCGCA